MTRINKSKEQIKAEMLLKSEISHEKQLASMIFPELQKQATVYDAQTLLHGLSGYIHHQIENRTNKILVSDLPVDLSQEKEGSIKDSFGVLLEMLKDEKADNLVKLLKRYGDMLGYYGSVQFLKNPMSSINEDDLIKNPKINE